MARWGMVSIQWIGWMIMRKGMIEKFVRSICVEEMCEYISLNGLWTLKICVSCVNVLQKVTSAEEDFNSQVDRMAVSRTVSLFPRSSLSLSNRTMNKVVTMAENQLTTESGHIEERLGRKKELFSLF